MCASFSAPIVLFHIYTKLAASMSWVEGPSWGTKFSRLDKDHVRFSRNCIKFTFSADIVYFVKLDTLLANDTMYYNEWYYTVTLQSQINMYDKKR